jgi:TPR repeat protein
VSIKGEIMPKLFTPSFCQGSFRQLIALFGLASFILLPYMSAAQDLSDLKRRAEQGDAAAQVNLGSMYGRGQGVQQDYREAAKWYKKAAEGGNAAGQHGLGVM